MCRFNSPPRTRVINLFKEGLSPAADHGFVDPFVAAREVRGDNPDVYQRFCHCLLIVVTLARNRFELNNSTLKIIIELKLLSLKLFVLLPLHLCHFLLLL